MQDWAKNLLALQEKDLRIDKLRQQLDAVPEEKEQSQRLLQEELEATKTAQNQVNDIKKAIKHIELDIEAANEKQRDFEKKTTMIKDNDEYRAAIHQIETCKNKIDQLEEGELEQMQELEDALKQLEEEKKIEAASEKRTAEMLEDLEKRAANCQTQIKKLQQEREELAGDVPDETLRQYERMRNSRLKTGSLPEVLVEVRDSTCMGCHMAIPPQVKTNARKGMREHCPQCGAMLYA